MNYLIFAVKQYQPFKNNLSVISKFFETDSITSSALVSIMPLIMYIEFSFINSLTPSDRNIIASATMFATTMSYLPVTFSVKLPSIAVKRSDTLLSSAFSLAVLTARPSISTPTAFFAPSNKDAIARIPLPQPTSSTVEFSVTTFSSTPRHRLVVS